MEEMIFGWNTGISICVDDLHIPKQKATMLKDASDQVNEIRNQYDEGLITDGERYNKVVDIWAQCADKIAKEMMQHLEKQFSPRLIQYILLLSLKQAKQTK